MEFPLNAVNCVEVCRVLCVVCCVCVCVRLCVCCVCCGVVSLWRSQLKQKIQVYQNSQVKTSCGLQEKNLVGSRLSQSGCGCVCLCLSDRGCMFRTKEHNSYTKPKRKSLHDSHFSTNSTFFITLDMKWCFPPGCSPLCVMTCLFF